RARAALAELRLVARAQVLVVAGRQRAHEQRHPVAGGRPGLARDVDRVRLELPLVLALAGRRLLQARLREVGALRDLEAARPDAIHRPSLRDLTLVALG